MFAKEEKGCVIAFPHSGYTTKLPGAAQEGDSCSPMSTAFPAVHLLLWSLRVKIGVLVMMFRYPAHRKSEKNG